MYIDLKEACNIVIYINYSTQYTLDLSKFIKKTSHVANFTLYNDDMSFSIHLTDC